MFDYFVVKFITMKYFSLAIVLLALITGCKESPIRKSFSSADSLVIHFKDESAGIVLKTVQTTEANAISRMVDFIEAPESQQYQCGFDGKMFFYDSNEKLVQEVDFQMKNDSCRHFLFMLNGKPMGTKMNPEAVDFLDALQRGLPVYY